MGFNLVMRVLFGHGLVSSNGVYCSVIIWNDPPHSAPGQAPKCTSIRYSDDNQTIDWNEELQVAVVSPAKEVLTLRVKDRSESLLGSCYIPLSHLKHGEPKEQWFKLTPVGSIYLKLELQSPKPSGTPQQPTSMYDVFQSVQNERRNIIAEQLKNNANIMEIIEQEKQRAHARINQQVRDRLQARQAEQQRFLDEMNQRVRDNQQAHQAGQQRFLDQMNENLRQYRQGQPAFTPQPYQTTYMPQYNPAIPQFNQQPPNNNGDNLRQWIGTAATVASALGFNPLGGTFSS